MILICGGKNKRKGDGVSVAFATRFRRLGREDQVPLASRVGILQNELLVLDVARHHEAEVARSGELLANGAVACDGSLEETTVGLLVAGDELVADDVEAELRTTGAASRHLIREVGELSVELHPVFCCHCRVSDGSHRDESRDYEKILHNHSSPFAGTHHCVQTN